MDCYMTLILLFFGFRFNSCSHLPKRMYYYIDLRMNWTDAQRYCREKYDDLATVESTDDINWLDAAAVPSFASSWFWIGLRDDPKSWRKVMGHDENSWRWSTTGETSKTGYQKWHATEPNNAFGNENCTTISAHGLWIDWDCKTLHSFVCYTATNQGEKTHVFISTWKNWTSAQAYCREHHTDLAMIENTAENYEVHVAKPGNVHAWIGLYRVPWTWSDKTQSSFRSWDSYSPNNYGGQHCVYETSSHKWGDARCDSLQSFICHRVTILKTTLRMKIQTDADITEPAANAQVLQQLGAVLTSQGWTDFKLQWKIQPRKQEKKEELKGS